MNKSFIKLKYEQIPGCVITHTKGADASGSTMGYQHLCRDYVLYYCIHGSADFRIEGHYYTIQPGDMLLINPTELFQTNVDPSLYHERIGIHITEAYLEKLPYDANHLLNKFKNREKGVGNHIPSEIVCKHGFEKIVIQLLQLITRNEIQDNLLAFCKITELLTLINQISFYPENSKEENNTSSADQILTYINEHFAEEITLETVAKEFFISPSYLSHQFKEQTGIPIWNYVILRRLQFFNTRIEKGDTIDQAYRNAGFQNYSNFFRLYKKNMGMTPTEYKKSLSKH